jgi:hypothetical protein
VARITVSGETLSMREAFQRCIQAQIDPQRFQRGFKIADNVATPPLPGAIAA